MQLEIKIIGKVLTLSILVTSCLNAQEMKPELVGGPCEGCEAVLEFGDRSLTPVDTLPDFKKNGTPIRVQGTVYENDGRTPAEGVIIYVYHTNQQGRYAPEKDSRDWGKRHGYIRGWVKTDSQGKYTYYTLKPGAYPSGTEPAHIHYTILEPNGKYYWLQSCHFSGDPLLTDEERTPESPRGGTSGLLNLQKGDGLMVGTRNIILGRNIPGY